MEVTRAQAALDVAAQAAELAGSMFGDRDVAVRTKRGPHDLVTEADERVERHVAGLLAERFPDDGFLGEEGLADRPSASGVTWAVDPVDGTWNFAAGIPHWCVVVACADADGPLVGVTIDVVRRETWSAARGGGELLLNGAPVERPVRDIADSTWAAALGPSFREPRWMGLMGRIGPLRLTGCLGLDLAWTAAGRFDALAYTCALRPWDVWAGLCMAREQGLEAWEEPQTRVLGVMPQGWRAELGLG
jgi:myo-inositol-1(or 4)-monophosphatase